VSRIVRNVLLGVGGLLGILIVLVLVNIGEAPTIACSAADMAAKENRNTREVWGPTDLNAQIGNQRLLVGTNQKGTMTVFKYPTPSYADQIKHHALDRRAPYYGSDPNAGAFLGVIVTTDTGSTRFDWLRDWGPVATTDPEYGEHVDQSWRSGGSDALVTTFHSDRLGLRVRVTNAVPTDTDVFIRDVTVTAKTGSPVTDVELVSYENFNLVEDKDALAPTQDWCSEDENGETATYDASTDAVVHSRPDRDHGWVGQGGAEFSIATAMAFDGASTQHQVAGDDERGDHPGDAYRLFTDGITELPGRDRFRGQTSAALTKDLDFDDGSGQARVYFAAASAPTPGQDLSDAAARKIETARGLSLPEVHRQKRKWFEQYVGGAPMPAGAPENVTRVSRRALVSVAQVWDGQTQNEHGFSGNLVASIATQGPYGADWIRDGAYFNYVLDRYFGPQGDGLHSWVAKHNRWYMSLQQNPGGPCPEHCHDSMKYYDFAGLVPSFGPFPRWFAESIPTASAVPRGGWAMNYYADGQPAGPLGGEIDETAYGAWTLWDHYAVTGDDAYLRRIYPAIRLVGEYLTEDCVEDRTGLQCPRPEDDNFERTQTIVGGASVYAGLASATKAAAAMHRLTSEDRYAEQALRFARRRDALGQAIETHYWNGDEGYYGRRSGFPSPRVAMPAFLRPVDDPKMEAHLKSMWANVRPTFDGERDQGQYEAKSLIGLGLSARMSDDSPVGMEKVRKGVEWIADHHARSNSTYVMGEAWVREIYADGEVDSAVSQPHVWEQLLFYMSSLIAYDDSSGTALGKMGNDVYATWRRHDASVDRITMASRNASYALGETVEGTATITNDAPVAQRYHLKVQVEGLGGERRVATGRNVGPIQPGDTVQVPISWSVGEGSAGPRDVRLSVWRAVVTGADDTVAPQDIAARPTALTAEQYRRVKLDADTLARAFEVSR
jgi:hypothetical protein